MPIVPNGEHKFISNVYILSLLLVWITLELSSSNRLCFLKCEEGSSGDIHTPLVVMVNVDLSWEAPVLGIKLLPCSLPHIIGAVTDIEAVLNFVDSCTLCGGMLTRNLDPLFPAEGEESWISMVSKTFFVSPLT